jgi:hypothetical protein
VPEYLKDREKRVKEGTQNPWMPELARMLKDSEAFRYITFNTVPNQKEVEGYWASLSGYSYRVKRLAREQLSNLGVLLDGAAEIDSTNALDTGFEMAHRIHRLGATAVSGVTFLWRSQNWKQAVDKMLTEFATATDNT